ncbi:MAG: SMI1/KNR4 family protein [Methylovirgula sp.]
MPQTIFFFQLCLLDPELHRISQMHNLQFNGNPPASGPSIDRCSAHLKRRLPPDYVRFLQHMNGGEGFIGKNYVVLWRVATTEGRTVIKAGVSPRSLMRQ